MKHIDLKAAHRHCIYHYQEILDSKICGCFYCKQFFTPDEIEEWVDTDSPPTALCPYCGIDAVIGDASGIPLTKKFLVDMYTQWFDINA